MSEEEKVLKDIYTIITTAWQFAKPMGAKPTEEQWTEFFDKWSLFVSQDEIQGTPATQIFKSIDREIEGLQRDIFYAFARFYTKKMADTKSMELYKEVGGGV